MDLTESDRRGDGQHGFGGQPAWRILKGPVLIYQSFIYRPSRIGLIGGIKYVQKICYEAQ